MRRGRVRWQMVAAGTAVIAIGVLAFLAAGGIGSTGTPTQQLRAWVDNTGLGGSIGTLVADAARVRLALAGHQGTGVVHTDCGVLLTDAQSANGELPTPDAALTQLLSSGYTSAYDAGYDCYNSAGTDKTLLARAARERIRAEAKLRAAADLVGRLTGVTLSTTTTTQPGDGGMFG